MARIKGLLLLSGGIDSPVAGYIVSRQADITALHFSNKKFAGTESIKKAKKISKKLGFKMLVIDLSMQLETIARDCAQAYYFVLMRRLFYRIAERVALKEKCSFIVTGESLGQVSSQTLPNLSVTARVVSIPVVRPLLGFNKRETTNIAKKIGTFDVSSGPEMCDVLGPKHPSTHASLQRVLEEEAKLSVEELVQQAIAQIDSGN